MAQDQVFEDDVFEEDVFEDSPISSIHPWTEKVALDLFADRVVSTQQFSIGDLVALTSTGEALADNTDAEKRAIGFVAAASKTEHWLIMGTRLVSWPKHGQGECGDRLWLGTGGGYVSSEPTGSSVVVVQEVALVWDENYLIVFPPPMVEL